MARLFPIVSTLSPEEWLRHVYGPLRPRAADHTRFGNVPRTLYEFAGTFFGQQTGLSIRNSLLLPASAVLVPCAQL
jgi:hypothetical protein